MGWQSSTAVGSLALVACTIGNPSFQESDGASASESGSTSDSGASFSSTSGSASASAGSTGGSASDSGDTSTGGETTGLTTGLTTGVTSLVTTSTSGETTGDPTTGDMTTTGGMDEVFCEKGEQLEITIDSPVTNTYVVSSGGEACQWKDSDNNTLNGVEPCDELNFGAFEVRYTLVGEDDDARSEMLLFFDVHSEMEKHVGYAISHAELEIVPWWGSNRSGVSFQVGVVAYEDTWFQGNKAAQLANYGDSSWKFRKIDGQLGTLPWSSGTGPAAGSTLAAVVNVGELAGGDHPWHLSSPIAGSLLAPWVAGASKEAGLVVSTSIAPILIKNKDAGYPPKLHLTLCPQ